METINTPTRAASDRRRRVVGGVTAGILSMSVAACESQQPEPSLPRIVTARTAVTAVVPTTGESCKNLPAAYMNSRYYRSQEEVVKRESQKIQIQTCLAERAVADRLLGLYDQVITHANPRVTASYEAAPDSSFASINVVIDGSTNHPHGGSVWFAKYPNGAPDVRHIKSATVWESATSIASRQPVTQMANIETAEGVARAPHGQYTVVTSSGELKGHLPNACIEPIALDPNSVDDNRDYATLQSIHDQAIKSAQLGRQMLNMLTLTNQMPCSGTATL